MAMHHSVLCYVLLLNLVTPCYSLLFFLHSHVMECFHIKCLFQFWQTHNRFVFVRFGGEPPQIPHTLSVARVRMRA